MTLILISNTINLLFSYKSLQIYFPLRKNRNIRIIYRRSINIKNLERIYQLILRQFIFLIHHREIFLEFHQAPPPSIERKDCNMYNLK